MHRNCENLLRAFLVPSSFPPPQPRKRLSGGSRIAEVAESAAGGKLWRSSLIVNHRRGRSSSPCSCGVRSTKEGRPHQINKLLVHDRDLASGFCSFYNRFIELLCSFCGYGGDTLDFIHRLSCTPSNSHTIRCQTNKH